MKKVLPYILSCTIFSFTYGQESYGQIEISAFKEVVIQTPADLKITSVKPGLDDRYIKYQIMPPNLLSIKAVEGTEFPPTNLTIYCEGAIFQTDLYLKQGTRDYYHKLEKKHGIILEAPLLMDATETTKMEVDRETEGSLPVQESNMLAYHPDYNGVEGPITPEYFNVDRHVEGTDLQNGVIVYINNVVATEKYIYISFKIRNDSRIPWSTDFVKLFITADEKNRKMMSTLDSGKEALFSTLVNNPNMEILPGNTEMYIYEFDKFSLSKSDYLALAIEEGDGKRSANIKIKSKRFDQLVEFKY